MVLALKKIKRPQKNGKINKIIIMKKIITSLLLFVSIFAFAQESAIADLKFEEAETAFNNQDYETTIKKLDEFDKLLGSIKDKSLYLRIISQDKLFDPTKLYENESQFNLLSSLRKNTNAYLKAMESSGLDERYREVYAINEKLVQYPKDKTAFQLEIKKINDNLDKYVGVYDSKDHLGAIHITKDNNRLYIECYLSKNILPLKFVENDEYLIEEYLHKVKFTSENLSLEVDYEYSTKNIFEKRIKASEVEIENLDNYTGIYTHGDYKLEITKKDNTLYLHSLADTIVDFPFRKVEKGKYVCKHFSIVYLSKEKLLFDNENNNLEPSIIKKIKP